MTVDKRYVNLLVRRLDDWDAFAARAMTEGEPLSFSPDANLPYRQSMAVADGGVNTGS